MKPVSTFTTTKEPENLYILITITFFLEMANGLKINNELSSLFINNWIFWFNVIYQLVRRIGIIYNKWLNNFWLFVNSIKLLLWIRASCFYMKWKIFLFFWTYAIKIFIFILFFSWYIKQTINRVSVNLFYLIKVKRFKHLYIYIYFKMSKLMKKDDKMIMLMESIANYLFL